MISSAECSLSTFLIISVKPVLRATQKEDQKLVFKTDYCLMQVKSIAECSKRAFWMLQESILQYFRPSLSYHLSLRPLFCLFLSCFTVLKLFISLLKWIYIAQTVITTCQGGFVTGWVSTVKSFCQCMLYGMLLWNWLGKYHFSSVITYEVIP